VIPKPRKGRRASAFERACREDSASKKVVLPGILDAHGDPQRRKGRFSRPLRKRECLNPLFDSRSNHHISNAMMRTFARVTIAIMCLYFPSCAQILMDDHGFRKIPAVQINETQVRRVVKPTGEKRGIPLSYLSGKTRFVPIPPKKNRLCQISGFLGS
jgi:hypothetical protein